MKRWSVLFVLFFATTAFAADPTITLGAESATESFVSPGQPSQCAAAAIADVGHAIFLAWPVTQDGQSGINMTLIDERLSEIAGSRRFMKLPDAPFCVSSASDGSSFALLWLSGEGVVHVMRLASDLSVLNEPVTSYLRAATTRPAVVWQPTERSYMGSITADAPSQYLPWITINRFEAASGNGSTTVAIARRFRPETTFCAGPNGAGRFPSNCQTTPAVSWVGVTQPALGGTEITLETLPSLAVLGETSVACAADDCLAIWQRKDIATTWARWIGGSAKFVIPGGGIRSGFASASDDESVFVVWESAEGIMGALLTREHASLPIVIAPAGVRRPFVAATGPGTYLVVYERSEGGTRVAGRYVFIDAPMRRRAAR